ncbi:hypothetical protein KIP88_04645 [Bradyrhizobium sp. SRL28]|uniref:hypothetical protein n=1 Tax=Bradyrhizobium sp. SRL28 TaxID=2836178 RepID=UPI001BDE3C96|nr:hypothetical protein [Bradyrhizobium sp. SRL28]MBT1509782.1 hypothetical protein [Bradyrhizobium sp. SRL28]
MDCFAALAMTVKYRSATQRIVILAKAGIQYAAAYRFNHCCLWILGQPVKPGDDN